MLMSLVVTPEALSAEHFSDPSYHSHAEMLLRDVDANGVILVDSNERIYNKLCDNVEALAATKKGKTSHALFEELLKKKRQKIVRFIATKYSFTSGISVEDACAAIAVDCQPDSLITDPDSHSRLAARVGDPTKVISMTDYIGSEVEVERRRWYELLPLIDCMLPGEFDRLIVGATKYSRWLRFYDKQIGKGTSLNRFRRGIEKILQLWVANSYFSKNELSVKLFTVADESTFKKCEPSVSYRRVKEALVEPLIRQFGIPIELKFKKDDAKICHARHLQTQSLAILFEKGFDFIKEDGSFCRTSIKPDAVYSHLQEYRDLIDFTLSTS